MRATTTPPAAAPAGNVVPVTEIGASVTLIESSLVVARVPASSVTFTEYAAVLRVDVRAGHLTREGRQGHRPGTTTCCPSAQSIVTAAGSGRIERRDDAREALSLDGVGVGARATGANARTASGQHGGERRRADVTCGASFFVPDRPDRQRRERPWCSVFVNRVTVTVALSVRLKDGTSTRRVRRPSGRAAAVRHRRGRAPDRCRRAVAGVHATVSCVLDVRRADSRLTRPGRRRAGARSTVTFRLRLGRPFWSTVATIVRRPARPSRGVNAIVPRDAAVVASTCVTPPPTSAKRTFWPVDVAHRVRQPAAVAGARRPSR